MELDLTDKPPVPDYTTFHQLCAEHLDQSPSALVNSPTQVSITALRDKVLDEPTLRSSAAKMFAVIDQWNAAQPISKLPPELIAHIVALGFPITHHFGDIGEWLPCFYMEAIASLATISRTWRNAIIGTPSLWGLLSTDLPPQINRISLQRSGTCPLMVAVVSWPNEPTSADELLDIALPHWNRWSHAQLAWVPRDRIMKQLTSAAPQLEALDFKKFEMVNSEPIDLFGGYAPSLQDIRVSEASVRWDSEVFRDLRKLKLESIGAIAADHVLTVLSASPLLELLSIVDAEVGFTPLPPSSARTPIQLPHLKSILLERVDVGTIGNILSFIHAPNCDSLRLYASWEYDDPFDATDFLSQSFGHFDAFIRSTVAFHGSSQLTLYPEHIEWLCGARGSDAPHLYFGIPSEMNISIPWISQFFGSELPRPAHELNVTLELNEVSEENFAGLTTLALLPNVQSFRTRYFHLSIGTVLSLLGDPNEDARARTFPGLKEFRLEGRFARPLQDLRAMLMCRYGESWQSVIGPPSVRIVLALPLGWPYFNIRPQFEEICRIRAMRGVESVTLIMPFGPEGMPACIYDDATGEYYNAMGEYYNPL